ncbi:winged helix-turn-helix domain-containing protein [Halobacterium jilantaiense]|uniref:Helix-turn-helix domain-containing protein n=1 Tax=Halobacterium jilantaiense TaxID=355548 RepID=A0A1I0Q8L1_9EURY|nr:helix-turn-helix domain-containing protein [Halobacterium jilantaiense]SEW23327.1 Helix-turn-helix domain-containing protein [Halobacterium jilantaiense]
MPDGDGFDLLADETRASILRELAAARRETPRDPAVSFSTLRERVGITDSGRFNYHVGELTGHFVESTDDGYRLSPVGQQAASSILADAYSDPPDRGPVDLDEHCGRCGDRLEGTYEDGILRVNCANSHGYAEALPPAVLEGATLQEATDALDAKIRGDLAAVRRDACPACLGSVDWQFETDLSPEAPVEAVYVAVCQCCGHQHSLNPGMFVFDHPAVVAAYHDVGVDLRDRPLWTIDCCVPGAATLSSTDPPRMRVTAGPERDCEFRLDATATVVDAPEQDH